MGGGSKSAGIQRSGCVLISPERLANQKFLQNCCPLIQGKIECSWWMKRIVSRIGGMIPAGLPQDCPHIAVAPGRSAGALHDRHGE